jgi:type IV fimbrial biogenesis protein FimT
MHDQPKNAREAGLAVERMPSAQIGFTLLELMVTVAVVAIIFAVAVPGMSRFFDEKRLIGAAEQVYGHLQEARMQSIARSVPVHVNFSVDGTDTWVYAVSQRNLCDLTKTTPNGVNACVVVVDDGDGIVDPGDGSADTGDLVLMRFDDSAHRDITLDRAGFSSGTTQIDFDPIRGTATAGDLVLRSADGKQLNVRVGLLGQIRICSPDGSVPRYSNVAC